MVNILELILKGIHIKFMIKGILPLEKQCFLISFLDWLEDGLEGDI